MPRAKLTEEERNLRDKEIENQKRKGTIFQNIKKLFSHEEVKELLNNYSSDISNYLTPNVSTLTSWILSTDFDSYNITDEEFKNKIIKYVTEHNEPIEIIKIEDESGDFLQEEHIESEIESTQ
jgi:hypothetical protein